MSNQSHDRLAWPRHARSSRITTAAWRAYDSWPIWSVTVAWRWFSRERAWARSAVVLR